MKMIQRTSFLFGSLFIMMIPTLVRADTGPELISTIGSIGVSQESPLIMTKEVIRFDLPSTLDVLTDWNLLGKKTVPARVTFWFHNPTDRAIEQKSFFPISIRDTIEQRKVYAKRVRVQINGRSVKATFRDGTYGRKNDDLGTLIPVQSKGYAFSFRVPAKKTVSVVVAFDAPLGDGYRRPHAYALNYLLESGAGWFGKIGLAEVQVAYPFKANNAWARLAWPEETSDVHVVAQGVAQRVISWKISAFEPKSGDVLTLYFLAPRSVKAHPDQTADEISPFEDEATAAPSQPDASSSAPTASLNPLSSTPTIVSPTIPTVPSDLIVTSTARDSVTIEWTVPILAAGDTYEIRLWRDRTAPMSVQDWPFAYLSWGEPRRRDPGMRQYFRVENLQPNTSYALGVRLCHAGTCTDPISVNATTRP